MTALFAGLARYATSQIVRSADADGQIPRSATYDLQRDIGERIVRLFVGRNRAGVLAPYEVLPDGSVMPLSSYMRILWASITDAMRIEVEREAAMMNRLLPAEVKAELAMRAGIAREQEAFSLDALMDYWSVRRNAQGQREVFAPNPLAGYDPPHLWVDPNGYRLSDRIWRTASETRRKIDAFLEDGIARGRGSLKLSRDLERFLHPGRQLVRTKTPYGTDASYDAMRLARTEITRAASQAHEAAAKANPFVEKLRWKLSPQHPCCDICDSYADKEYEFDDLPTQPAHPHCLCYWENVITEDSAAILDQAREEIRAARRAWQRGPVPIVRSPSRRETDLQQEIDSMRPIMEAVIEEGDPTGAGLKSVIDTLEQQLNQERELNQALWDAFGIGPEQASDFEWQQLADQLHDEGIELYNKYTKEGIRSYVAQMRGAQDSGWMVVGKEQIQVRQGAFSVSAARRMEGELWAEAKEDMAEAMGQLLKRAGYSERDIAKADFYQLQRLLDELGDKELLITKSGRPSQIDRVPVESRERVTKLVDFDLAAVCEESATDPLALPTLDAYGKLELSDLIRATKITGSF